MRSIRSECRTDYMKKYLISFFLLLSSPLFSKCLEHRYLLLENRDENVLERIDNIYDRAVKRVDIRDRIFSYPVRFHRQDDNSCMENYLFLRQVAFFQKKKVVLLHEAIDKIKIAKLPPAAPQLPLNGWKPFEHSENYYLFLEKFLTQLEDELDFLGL